MKITTKIKMYGAVLISLMLSLIVSSIYLNEKNVKDALLINTAGKQKMLTQKISKDIFYIYNTQEIDYTDLDNSADEFMQNLKFIREHNELKEIFNEPKSNMAMQMDEVDVLWKDFYLKMERFKEIRKINQNDPELKDLVHSIYTDNTRLLNKVDGLVTMLAHFSENKINDIKKLQYLFGFLLIVLMIYFVFKLKSIEANALAFLEYTKSLSISSNSLKIKPLDNKVETEIVEMGSIVNSFINKINSAIDYSNEAVAQSKNASIKLEEITEELDSILGELADSLTVTKHLSVTENIAIQSTEDLLNSTKKLKKLRDELNKLLIACIPK